jgi:hypothetical protein
MWSYIPACADSPLIPSGYRQEAMIPEAIAERGRACIPPAQGDAKPFYPVAQLKNRVAIAIACQQRLERIR